MPSATLPWGEGLASGVALGAFCILMVTAAVIDARELRIPNWLTGGMAALWVVARVLGRSAGVVGALGGIAAAVIFGGGSLLLARGVEALTGRPALGGGDVKLIAAMSLYLGVPRTALALMVACVAHVVAALVLAGLKRRSGGERKAATAAGFPFAPALALGAFAALLFAKVTS